MRDVTIVRDTSEMQLALRSMCVFWWACVHSCAPPSERLSVGRLFSLVSPLGFEGFLMSFYETLQSCEAPGDQGLGREAIVRLEACNIKESSVR